MAKSSPRVPLLCSSTAMDSSKQHQILNKLQISGWASANRVSLTSQLVNFSEHGFSTFFQNDDILPQKSLSLPTLAPTATLWRPTSGKGPSEGCGILVQDQQDPSAQLDGGVEGRLPGVVANLILQLMLVVGVGAHPVSRLIGQLTQRSVTLEARHELAHRLQPSVGDKPQQHSPTTFEELAAMETQEHPFQTALVRFMCLFIFMP